ncbi:MAG: hypothetical protein F6K36_29615, partial [Symploca sp. SIO3C6]|nr:hypothetical protein [Symploca sp. SIO3C6]
SRYKIVFEDFAIKKGKEKYKYQFSGSPRSIFSLYIQGYRFSYLEEEKICSDYIIHRNDGISEDEQDIKDSEVMVGVNFIENGKTIISVEESLLITSHNKVSYHSHSSWYLGNSMHFQHPNLSNVFELINGAEYTIEILTESQEDLSEKLCLQPYLVGGSAWGI